MKNRAANRAWRSPAFILIAGAALLAASLCLALPAAAQQSRTGGQRADAEKDPVLKAMLDEMDRSMTQLQLQGFAKPFFIQYRIEDVDDFATLAEFGASVSAQRARQRVARVTVRVGDYKTDSSGGRGDGSIELAALDNDPIAIRSALWEATDQAYKNALDAYAQKQAALKQVQTPPQADDFSHEKPVISLVAQAGLTLDENEWAGRIARVSGLYRTDASVKADQRNVEYSLGSFHARATTTWLVTSEGTIVRKAATDFDEDFVAGTQAADGMHLGRSYESTGVSLNDLDSEQAFDQRAVTLIASLAELRKAPVVEDEYHGPLLLSADAGTETLHALLAGAVAATRPPLGTEARTNGPFASSFQARVLPDSLSVVDDPGLTTFNGKGLVGAYAIDDEGVPAQAVTLVDGGRLENYLLAREPIKDFPQSNGHGRASAVGPARASIGVLKISAKDGLSDPELNSKLLEMMKAGGLTHAYFAETLAEAGNPRMLYRINADGTRQLVRGAELDDVDQRALRSSVEAVGKDLFVANYFGDTSTTVIGPALLLDDATVKRANQKNEKLPFYPPPE